MGTDVVSASRELIVVVAVVLVYCRFISVLDKPYELGHMKFFGEVLDVEA